MSHLHIPDGLLPVWLWVTGLALAMAAVLLSLYMVRKMDLRKKVPLLGMMSAVMLVGMSLEVVPTYHVNLSIITGIVIGPWLMIIASLIVNLLLALVGHGGITVVGLNTLVIGAEGIMGYVFFTVLRKLFKPGLAAGLSAFGALFFSTCLMLLVVFISNINLGADSLHEVRELIGSPTADSVAALLRLQKGFNFRFFAYAAILLGSIGWVIEAFVTAAAVRFISLVKPDMISRGGR